MIDPREYGDRQLLAYLAFGHLPRPGWGRRRRVLALRGLLLLAMARWVLVGLAFLRLLVIVAWAVAS